jgi:hypothetical protein
MPGDAKETQRKTVKYGSARFIGHLQRQQLIREI